MRAHLHLRMLSGSLAGKSMVVPAKPLVTIGRGEDCDVVLLGWNVNKLHARLSVNADNIFIEDAGTLFGTWVNEERITRYGPLTPKDQFMIGGHQLQFGEDSADQAVIEDAPSLRQSDISEALSVDVQSNAVHDEVLLLPHLRRMHKLLIERLDFARVDISKLDDAALESSVRSIIGDILAQEKLLPAAFEHQALSRRLLDETLGLGPLESLLRDEDVTEIMVNKHDEIWVERRGRIARSPIGFSSDRAVLGTIERIVTPLGRRIDESSPMVDARLKDGSRVNAIIPPLALRGPSLTIRKFPRHRMGPQDLLKGASVSLPMLQLLELAVKNHLNIIVSGGTGTGKTTFLNVLSSFIPQSERIVTIEDAAELSLGQPNIVTLESRPPNVEGKGEVAIRDLVRNSLRMRPDRIVIGECRGGEALDMLQAMNTGHDGALTTLHANTSRDALARLEVLVMMAGTSIPIHTVRDQIASAVDLLVQLVRLPCGQRKVSQITEINGCANGVIQMQDIFVYQKTGTDTSGLTQGRFVYNDSMPDFVQKWRDAGIQVDWQKIIDAKEVL